ncbi:MarR family winged helix-turn-helix transcriptional regulator [Micrococcus terreus]|uniref:MarR family winged helix-turn-helix transcriptional regulator n=1 Tax=Micrococcus terreus TaxID=574650 RepID=UPI0023F681B6|nr:MarR family transcriptional regulator [Micrococcus terreus]
MDEGPVDDLTDQAAGTDAPEVRWLDPVERRAWLSMVATHMQLMPALEADLQEHGAVSIFEYQVLAVLSEHGDPLPMSELASRTNSSLSRLSHAARKLEKRGWIQRSTSPVDARVTLAQMTEVGMQEVMRLAPVHVRSVRRRLLDVLDARDLEDIGRIGGKLIGHLKPDHWVFRDPALTEVCPQRQEPDSN